MSAKKDLEALQTQFEQRVVDRVRLILRAERIAPGTTFNAAWSDEQIRATAVSASMGPGAIDGKSTEYVEARFDHLAEQTPPDPVAAILADRADRRH